MLAGGSGRPSPEWGEAHASTTREGGGRVGGARGAPSKRHS